MKTLKILSFAAFASLFLSSCGGGGGGDDFVGAALVDIDAVPNKIDSGDRMNVTSSVGEVHQNGIALKFKFPTGLNYIKGSAKLTIYGESTEITPTVNEASSEDSVVYLVFYLTQAQFTYPGDDYNGEFGTVSFELEGISEVKDGRLGVDADVDDPTQENSSEFQIATPEFAAEADIKVEVRDD